MHPVDVIQRKRDGHALSAVEIDGFIQAVVQRSASDAQIAAFLMAIFLRGMNRAELATFTAAMRDSGETFDASPLATFTVDKHSTGGVGDKTSLLIAPVVAAAGLRAPTPAGVPGACVPMISGRSLGHTGGTLDKLESIPGFNPQQPLTRVAELLRETGAALIGQTPALVPADRILYALRDHTGTVESPELIAASIMSKKLAEDLNALVLDVKAGSGAFLPAEADARHLARLLVETGEAAGTRTVALLTRMDEPLGRYAGNWLEVLECVDILQGRRHPLSRDLILLSNTLAGWMLHLAGLAASPETGVTYADELLASGAAYQAWLKIVAGQGGDTSVFHHPETFHQPNATCTLTAGSDGFLSEIDCRAVGGAIQRLGAGRARPGDPVSAHAGIEVHARLGDRIAANQPLITLFAEEDNLLHEAYEMLRAAYRIDNQQKPVQPIILDVIELS
jgi:pyrimidine-nucleoside phosphorylase